MTLCDLQRPLSLLNRMKYLCIHNVTIHIFFYQNQFRNECDRTKKLKSRFTVSVFFLRCRRTYVLNKLLKPINKSSGNKSKENYAFVVRQCKFTQKIRKKVRLDGLGLFSSSRIMKDQLFV